MDVEKMFILMICLLFSLGSINALIPIVIILVLLVAAAGLNRGYSMFNFFGLTTLAGINPGGKASPAGKTGFNFPAGIIPPAGRAGQTMGAGRRVYAGAKRLNALRKKTTNIMKIPGSGPSRLQRMKGVKESVNAKGEATLEAKSWQDKSAKEKAVTGAAMLGRAVMLYKPRTTEKKIANYAENAKPKTAVGKKIAKPFNKAHEFRATRAKRPGAEARRKKRAAGRAELWGRAGSEVSTAAAILA